MGRRLDPVLVDLYQAVRHRGEVGKVFNIKTVSRDSPKPGYEFLENCGEALCVFGEGGERSEERRVGKEC